MIQLRSECLMFTLPGGVAVPCSVEDVTVELIGEIVGPLSPDLVQNAASAVFHYFRVEQGKNAVSVGEFASALARVLRGFGLTVSEAEVVETPAAPCPPLDLHSLASESGSGCELFFFPLLKQAVRRKLTDSTPAQPVQLRGLRPCVKMILGAQRWSRRCQILNDEIVEYVRACFNHSDPASDCTLDLR